MLTLLSQKVTELLREETKLLREAIKSLATSLAKSLGMTKLLMGSDQVPC